MEKSKIGYFTKTLENGKIELFISLGDGVAYFIEEFFSMAEVDKYISENFPEWDEE